MQRNERTGLAEALDDARSLAGIVAEGLVVQDAVDAAVGVVVALHGAASLAAALAAPGCAADGTALVASIDSLEAVATS